MTDYITSDLHLYHRKILEFCPETRPFGSIEEMNESYIQLINNILLEPSAHLYILGDFSFKGKQATRNILDRLPCDKMSLILGNHDRHMRGLYKTYFHRVEDYLEIDVNYDWMEKKEKVCMFHFPIEDWNRKNHGSIHLHGHEHGSFVTGSRRRDVGIDGQGHFYTLEEVVANALKDDIVKTHHAD